MLKIKYDFFGIHPKSWFHFIVLTYNDFIVLNLTTSWTLTGCGANSESFGAELVVLWPLLLSLSLSLSLSLPVLSLSLSLSPCAVVVRPNFGEKYSGSGERSQNHALISATVVTLEFRWKVPWILVRYCN